MIKTWTHRKACRLCNSRHLTPLLKVAYTPPASCLIRRDGSANATESIPLIVTRCEKCQLIQQLDVVNPDLLFADYPFTRPQISPPPEHIDRLVQEAITHVPLQPGDLVIEIGCGDGTLLRAFAKRGMKVVGIDPSAAAQQQAATHHTPCYRDFFSPGLVDRIAKEHGRAKLILARDTLGAIDNLHAVMAGVRFLLEPEGVMMIEEPCLDDLLSQNRFDLIQHERITFLTATTFEPFARATHMHLIDAHRLPEHGGRLRLTVQRSDGPHVVAATLAERIADEKRAGIHTAEAFNAFAGRVEALKNALRQMVANVRADGRTVAGYGATAATVTFLHEAAWTTGTLAYVVDHDPAKHGMRLPGTDIPIEPPDRLRHDPPGAIVLFSGEDAGPLLEELADFRKNGGVIITPFPQPALLT
jgi:novobiocin biosynthesis protein NovU/D-mycarose 3-C-methyltransferase